MGFCGYKLSGYKKRTIYLEIVDEISEKVEKERERERQTEKEGGGERETSATPVLGISEELWIERYFIKAFLEIESGTNTYGFVTEIIGDDAGRN